MIVTFLSRQATAQELYVFSEPASNMPANSISGKVSAMFANDNHSGKTLQRYTPEIMLGLSKKWMVHGSFTIANMHQDKFILESGKLYGKWRFLSRDDVHRHFRMAAFAGASYSRNRPYLKLQVCSTVEWQSIQPVHQADLLPD